MTKILNYKMDNHKRFHYKFSSLFLEIFISFNFLIHFINSLLFNCKVSYNLKFKKTGFIK